MVKSFKHSNKKTFRGLLKEIRNKPSFFPQPIRTQPNMEMFYEHPEWSLSTKIAKATAKDVKDWGPRIVADIKYDGVRGLLYVSPRDKTVRVFSRRMKELPKLENRYEQAILENISNLIKDETVFDVELYATGQDGKMLPLSTVAGWARNPDPNKYKDLKPSIEVFDIILMNQRDLREMPLKFRKKMIELALKKKDGRILDIADTRLMKNHPRPIEWRFKAVIKGKGEGLVLKKEDSDYFYGKPKGQENPWRKLKAVDTLDLEMKAVEGSPRGKEFEDYRHWIMVPDDAEEHEINANKGIRAATFDAEFYRSFTLDMIQHWQKGLLVPQGKMLKVRKDLVPYYGATEVPEKLFYPKDKRMIVEIFAEKITENLQPTGTKIVGIRFDKDEADKIGDIDELRKFFLGVAK